MPFNTFYCSSLTPHNQHDSKSQKQSSSHSKNSLLDDALHPIVSKQQSSSTNSLVRDSLPSSSVPKLLLKRSSFKPPSTTAASMKPNPVLSITDASISSSNTIATDHLLNTHSTMSDYDKIIASKKGKKNKLKTKDKPKTMADLLPRFNVLRKTSPPSLIDSNKTERVVVHTSKMKTKKTRLLKTSQSTYETEPKSEEWIRNHQENNQLVMVDEQTRKKKKKKRIRGNNNPISHIDSSKCKHISASSSI